MGAIVIALPAAPDWKNQQAFATVFGVIPRILAASLIAFWAGEFANSYTMARLKLLTNGRMLWTRTIGSTVVGQAVDTTVVISLTFAGTVGVHTLLRIIGTGYLLKVAYEVLATPLTYLVINWLKRAEQSDPFDRHEHFNPFRFRQDDSPAA
jgi:queuosine precursor transporter